MENYTVMLNNVSPILQLSLMKINNIVWKTFSQNFFLFRMLEIIEFKFLKCPFSQLVLALGNNFVLFSPYEVENKFIFQFLPLKLSTYLN